MLFSRLEETRGKQRWEHARIQAWLRWRAGAEKISIGGLEVAIRVDDNQVQNAESDNPRVYQNLLTSVRSVAHAMHVQCKERKFIGSFHMVMEIRLFYQGGKVFKETYGNKYIA